MLYYVYSKSCLILFCLWINRYDILPVTCVETAVFGAKDLDNPGHHWMVIDSDYCPWPEEYDDDTYGAHSIFSSSICIRSIIVIAVVA